MLKSGELSEPFSFRIRWPRVEIPRVYGELWGERTRRLLERLERDSMSTHRVDDGTLQGAPFDPAIDFLHVSRTPGIYHAGFIQNCRECYPNTTERCPQCLRVGWMMDDKCWQCGHQSIAAICTPPSVMHHVGYIQDCRECLPNMTEEEASSYVRQWLECSQCLRTNWVVNDKCWDCGHQSIAAICTPPPIMTTPSSGDPLTTAQDDVKTTLDGWSKGKQALAYKYLYSLGHRIVNASDDVRKEYGGRK